MSRVDGRRRGLRLERKKDAAESAQPRSGPGVGARGTHRRPVHPPRFATDFFGGDTGTGACVCGASQITQGWVDSGKQVALNPARTRTSQARTT